MIEDRATAAAIQAVANEPAHNRDVLERWAPYHGEISRDLEARLEEGADGLTVFRRIFHQQEYVDKAIRSVLGFLGSREIFGLLAGPDGSRSRARRCGSLCSLPTRDKDRPRAIVEDSGRGWSRISG